MNFTLFSFWSLLMGGISAILLVRHLFKNQIKNIKTFDKISLCLLNMALLFSESRLTLAIFCSVLAATYVSLLWLRRSRMTGWHRTVFLGLLLCIQFSPLIYYKYGYFIFSDIFHVPEKAGFLKGILIPTGLSFYTFQMVSFVLDYAKDHARFPAFLDYCNFAGFFPQIVAGPIERRDDLLPQMEQFRWVFSWENLWEGVRWIVIGLFFKLSLAENIAAYSGWCYEPTDNAYLIWLGSALFGLRIYYDFAGYSLIAVGLGRALGIRLEMNFWSPYTAADIQEFWRQWHRTLSGWFRDYVYIPMGGGRRRSWAFNILVVFVVSGIWHGAGFNFMLWGAAHGMLLMLHRVFRPFICKLPRGLTWGLTMGFVVLSWLFFYQTDWNVLAAKMVALCDLRNYAIPNAGSAARALGLTGVFGVLSWGGLAVVDIFIAFIGLRRAGNPYHYYKSCMVLGLLVAWIVFTAPVSQNAFIYFNF